MAKPASNSGWSGLISNIAELLAPFPGRLEFAARLALICALTTLVVEMYQTPDQALTAYLAFFVMKPDRATSVIISFVLIIVMSLTLILTLLIAMAVIDDAMWRVVAMTALSFCLLFAASASKLKPIAAIVALIVGYAVDLLGQIQIGEIATRALLYAWLFVAIPAGVSIAVNLLIGPAPRRLLEKALARRLRLGADVLRRADEETRELFASSLHEGAGELPELLKAAALEGTSRAEDIAALRQACSSTAAIMSLVDLIVRDPSLLPVPERRRLGRTLELMVEFFERGRYPTEVGFAPEAERADLPPLTTAVIAELNEALGSFAEPSSPDPPPEVKPKKSGGFFLPDAFTNPAHVHYAIKTTAAAIFCYIVYQLLDWPGIHTCMITVYIVSLGTTAETMEKLTLRLAGCLIGAGTGLAAIVWLMPHITAIGGLMAVVFVAALVSGWVAAGGPRIAYAGFQIAFAFLLCVVQGSAPAFDLTVARDRMIGVVFGNLVVSVIFTQLWPVTVADRIDPAIDALLRLLAKFAGARSPAERLRVAEETQSALGAVRQDLDLTAYEPPSIGPEPSWVNRRRRILTAIEALEGPLLLGAHQTPELGGDLQRRLDRVADAFASDSLEESKARRGIGRIPEPKTTGAEKSAIHAFVDPPLAALEQAVGEPPLSPEQAENAPYALS